MNIRIASLIAAVVAVVALAVAAVPVQADPEGPGHTHEKPATKAPAKTAGGEAVLTTKVTPATLAGEIVDPQCWIQHDGRGKAHTGCALACAKAGQTLAFLDDKTGKLYQVLAPSHSADPNEPLYPWVGKPVIVKGDLMARGGMNAIVIKSVVADRAAKQRP